MLLCRSLAGLVPRARSFHQRRTRRPFPVVPERRMNVPSDTIKPPRILVKSYYALQKIDSDEMRNRKDAPADPRDDSLSK